MNKRSSRFLCLFFIAFWVAACVNAPAIPATPTPGFRRPRPAPGITITPTVTPTPPPPTMTLTRTAQPPTAQSIEGALFIGLGADATGLCSLRWDETGRYLVPGEDCSTTLINPIFIDGQGNDRFIALVTHAGNDPIMAVEGEAIVIDGESIPFSYTRLSAHGYQGLLVRCTHARTACYAPIRFRGSLVLAKLSVMPFPTDTPRPARTIPESPCKIDPKRYHCVIEWPRTRRPPHKK